MEFKNQFVVSGQLNQKRTAEKNGTTWGWFFGIAGLGSTIEVRVTQADYTKYETGAAVACVGRLEQRGYNINLIAEKVGPATGAKAA